MDPEIKAMADLAAALSPLNEEEIRRVLGWAQGRYLGKLTPITSAIASADEARQIPSSFGSVVDLIDAAKPSNGLERILVSGYWFQVIRSADDFDSQSLNTELKHMGYPSANITRDMESLMNRVPKLVIQTRKEGTTQQARKRYRLTREGIRAVENLLQGRKTGPDE